jgi:two-component system nitrate/nitrite response regulator NarP
MADRTRLLLIDDHPLFREAIARLLAGQPDFEIAGESATVDGGLAVLREKSVDIVLLDINLGLQQGGAFLNLARLVGFEGKILVVTAGVSKFEAARLMQRGCSGIILKQERPQLLIEKIRAIVNGSDQPDFLAMNRVIEQAAASNEIRVPLTRRERQVLRRVFGGQTNKEIAFELGVSEPLVKSVMQQLFMKTGVRTRAQLVRSAVEKYWKDLEEETEEA